jgi:rhodanese-related sulfurtransferase
MADLVELEPAQVQALLAGDAITLIDVREPAEFAAFHIAGAVSAPLSTLSAAALPPGAPDTLVFNCGIGKRSALAVARLQQAGVPVTQHLRGGLAAWKAAGLPVAAGG